MYVDDERNKTSIATDRHWQWPPGNVPSTWVPSAGTHSITGPVSLSGSVRGRKEGRGEREEDRVTGIEEGGTQ